MRRASLCYTPDELHERFIRACGYADRLPEQAEETKRLLELAYKDGTAQDNNPKGISAETFVHFLYYVVDFAQLFALFSGAAKSAPGVPTFRIEDRDNIDVGVFAQSLPSLVVWAADNIQFKKFLEERVRDASKTEALFQQLCTEYGGEKGKITFPDLTDWAIRTAAEMDHG